MLRVCVCVCVRVSVRTCAQKKGACVAAGLLLLSPICWGLQTGEGAR